MGQRENAFEIINSGYACYHHRNNGLTQDKLYETTLFHRVKSLLNSRLSVLNLRVMCSASVSAFILTVVQFRCIENANSISNVVVIFRTRTWKLVNRRIFN